MAILSAILSTIDSQLLVSSSSLSQDLYGRAVRRDAGQREVVRIGKICVIANSLVILVVNRMVQQKEARVPQQFDEIARELRGIAGQAAAPQVGYDAGI